MWSLLSTKDHTHEMHLSIENNVDKKCVLSFSTTSFLSSFLSTSFKKQKINKKHWKMKSWSKNNPQHWLFIQTT